MTKGKVFTPSGMTRTADGSVESTTPVKTVGWSADPTFPGTVVVNNGLQMDATIDAILSINATFYATFGQNISIAPYVNGVQRAAPILFPVTAYADVTRSGTILLSVTEGEVVDLYAWGEYSFAYTVRANARWSIGQVT